MLHCQEKTDGYLSDAFRQPPELRYRDVVNANKTIELVVLAVLSPKAYAMA